MFDLIPELTVILHLLDSTGRKLVVNMATTIAPEGVPPEVVNARRTESIDAPHILGLVEESTNSLFGRVNVVNIM